MTGGWTQEPHAVRGNVSDNERWWLQRIHTDPDAFVHLYDLYKDRIFTFLCKQARDEQLAGELFSDTFARAVEKLDSFEYRGENFGSWLFKIANNVWLGHLRRRKQRTRFEDKYQFEVESAEDRTLEDLIRNEEQGIVQAAMDELDEATRDTIRQFYWDGRTTKQIAKIRGESEGTIKSRLSRGRDKLEGLLKKDFEERRDDEKSAPDDDRGKSNE